MKSLRFVFLSVFVSLIFLSAPKIHAWEVSLIKPNNINVELPRGVFEFNPVSYTATEGKDLKIVITIERTGYTGEDALVYYENDAKETLAVSFSKGDAAKTFEVEIKDDSDCTDKTLHFKLVGASKGEIGSADLATVTILNDDKCEVPPPPAPPPPPPVTPPIDSADSSAPVASTDLPSAVSAIPAANTHPISVSSQSISPVAESGSKALGCSFQPYGTGSLGSFGMLLPLIAAAKLLLFRRKRK